MKTVVAALVIREERILIAQRAEGDPLAGAWEFPGGKVEAGETPEEALVREMREEFLIDVTVGRFVAESTYDYGRGSLRLVGYLTAWNGTDLKPQVHAQIAWPRILEVDEERLLPADLPLLAALRELEVT